MENLDDKVLTVTIESAYEWNIRAHRLTRGTLPSAGAGSEMFGNLVVWISSRLEVRARESARALEQCSCADAAGFLGTVGRQVNHGCVNQVSA